MRLPPSAIPHIIFPRFGPTHRATFTVGLAGFILPVVWLRSGLAPLPWVAVAACGLLIPQRTAHPPSASPYAHGT
jgi:hypothetical protein